MNNRCNRCAIFKRIAICPVKYSKTILIRWDIIFEEIKIECGNLSFEMELQSSAKFLTAAENIIGA
jgi:hypothetical protein